MSDITTRWDALAGIGDWALSLTANFSWTDENGNSLLDEHRAAVSATFEPGTGLLAGSDLLTAVLISLFTDAEAAADDVIPDGSDDPRGWWGGAIGSKLWLRLRSKALPTIAAFIKDDIQQALAWLVSDGVAAGIDVATEWFRPSALGVQIVIHRNDGSRRALAFARVWETI